MQKVPVFVKIEEYDGLLQVMNAIKRKLQEASDVMEKVSELKKREDSELQVWKKELGEVGRRLSEIDGKLTNPKE